MVVSMANMIPSSTKEFHDSRGEEKVFYALRGLPDHITVIHSLRWLHPGHNLKLDKRIGAQGEGDFVIFDPKQGIMVIEVKGGEIWCERGEWHQKNRKTGDHKVIRPEEQASNTAYRIREEMIDRAPHLAKLLFCHAVWFPEGMPDRSNLPFNCPSDIVLDEEDIFRPGQAIDRAFAHWRHALPNRGQANEKEAKAALNALAPSFSLVPSVRRSVEEREEQLVQMTREQGRIVTFLDEQHHAAIHGAAGTGKTMIALEKARRLGGPKDQVLFLCYNNALQRHLQQFHKHPHVTFATFHGLARELAGPGGSLDDAERKLLDLLVDDEPLPYDHLIVDEGQDLTDWLEFFGNRFRDGTFYVFYDRNQIMQAGNLTWLDSIPCRLVLSRNCRNTDEIARVAYRAGGLNVSPTLGLSGPKPILHVVDTIEDAARLTEKLLVSAREDQKAEPHEMAVLTLAPPPEDSPLSSMSPQGLKLSRDPTEGSVSVMTAWRFKGLEARIVIVPDVDFSEAGDTKWRNRLYVACSRARQQVHLIAISAGQNPASAAMVFADSDKARRTWRALAKQLGAELSQGGKDDPVQEH
ncbi:AAA family ATPase [Rhizobium leguminosarum]|nr:AAA family ATPase [Rhizobium ruizarguesonis]